jgi:hypothetical protein
MPSRLEAQNRPSRPHTRKYAITARKENTGHHGHTPEVCHHGRKTLTEIRPSRPQTRNMPSRPENTNRDQAITATDINMPSRPENTNRVQAITATDKKHAITAGTWELSQHGHTQNCGHHGAQASAPPSLSSILHTASGRTHANLRDNNCDMPPEVSP